MNKIYMKTLKLLPKHLRIFFTFLTLAMFLAGGAVVGLAVVIFLVPNVNPIVGGYVAGFMGSLMVAFIITARNDLIG